MNGINQQVLEGKWNEVKGSIRQKWGQINQDQLQRSKGNVDQLIGLIQRETGEAREQIEAFLADLTSNGSAAVSRAAEVVKDYAHQAADRFATLRTQTADGLANGYAETERVVRNRPVESLVACFGTGLIAGLLVGLISRSK